MTYKYLVPIGHWRRLQDRLDVVFVTLSTNIMLWLRTRFSWLQPVQEASCVSPVQLITLFLLRPALEREQLCLQRPQLLHHLSVASLYVKHALLGFKQRIIDSNNFLFNLPLNFSVDKAFTDTRGDLQALPCACDSAEWIHNHAPLSSSNEG